MLAVDDMNDSCNKGQLHDSVAPARRVSEGLPRLRVGLVQRFVHSDLAD